MANPLHRFPDNVPGAWYVDTECITCGLCENLAPRIFRATADYDHNFVHRQPETPDDIAAAEDARESCPVEAIGKDQILPMRSKNPPAEPVAL